MKYDKYYQKLDLVAVLTWDKVDFKEKANKKENCYIIIKDSTQQEDKTILNMYKRSSLNI